MGQGLDQLQNLVNFVCGGNGNAQPEAEGAPADPAPEEAQAPRTPTPSPKAPTPNSFNETTTPSPSSPPPPPPTINRKRRRPDRSSDPIDAFLDRLVEAVDREQAIRDLDGEIGWWETRIADLRESIDEKVSKLSFLEPLVPEIPDLATAVEELNSEKDIYEHSLEERQEDLARDEDAKSRCRWEMERFVREVYQGADQFFAALDKELELGLRLGPVQVSAEFTRLLRLCCDVSRAIVQRRKEAQATRKELLRLMDAERSAGNLGQRSRRSRRKAEAAKRLQQAERMLDLQVRQQQERERRFLLEVARPFLVENKLMFVEKPLSAASSDKDLEEIDHRPDSGIGRYPPGPIGQVPMHRALVHWTKTRHDLLKIQNNRSKFISSYSSALANHLYAHPTSSKAALDALVNEKDNIDVEAKKNTHEENVQKFTQQYVKTKDTVKRLGVQHTLLSPEWAGEAGDVAPSQASTLKPYTKPEILAHRRKEIGRWRRKVARDGTPLSPSLPAPEGGEVRTPEGLRGYEELGVEYPYVSIGTTSLSPRALKRRIDFVEAGRTRARCVFKGSGRFKYQRTPMMAD